RGDTDSELFFHLFLSFLHDSGSLDQSPNSAAATRAALRATISLIERLRAEAGASGNGMNLLVTDGEHMVAVHGSVTMGYQVIKGRPDLERLLGDDTLRRIRIPDMASCRFCLVASDFDDEPRGWTTVAPHAIVTITRTDDPTVEDL
ncbi:MAG TPA: class II glutamine amidotransferase, partial [Polyangiaceae bacterium]|nr:class II glutamine amidotransferase [Polyangiaceae bacterium]